MWLGARRPSLAYKGTPPVNMRIRELRASTRRLGLLPVAVLTACAAAAPAETSRSTTTPRAEPASSSAVPSATLEPAATPASSPSLLPPEGLGSDSIAVTMVDNLRVRVEPSTTATSIGLLGSAGAEVFVFSGPIIADGHQWYELASLEPPTPCMPATDPSLRCRTWFGWAAAGSTSGDEWLVPRVGGCVNGPVDTAAFVNLSALERLACFGGATLTLRAYRPPPLPTGCGLTPLTFEPGWLNGCGSVTYLLVNEDSGFPGPGVEVHVSPELGVCQFGGLNPGCPFGGLEDQWVEVRGHLDDPAAATCVTSGPDGIGTDVPDARAVILACRASFVATAITPVSTP
jgi:hypothetical protein